jgi:hypothetical protein
MPHRNWGVDVTVIIFATLRMVVFVSVPITIMAHGGWASQRSRQELLNG